jgi:hypothetical protein
MRADLAQRYRFERLSRLGHLPQSSSASALAPPLQTCGTGGKVAGAETTALVGSMPNKNGAPTPLARAPEVNVQIRAKADILGPNSVTLRQSVGRGCISVDIYALREDVGPTSARERQGYAATSIGC